MANLAQSVAYAPEADTWNGNDTAVIPGINRSKKSGNKIASWFGGKKARRLTEEDIEIVAALEAVKSDVDFLHNCFDHTTDTILIDSLIYELKAANLKYQYYLNLCKEKGIVCESPLTTRG